MSTVSTQALEKKRKDYAFWRQFNEKPNIIPGCPGHTHKHYVCIAVLLRPQHDKSLFVISTYDDVAPMHGISKQVGKREVVTVLTRRESIWCGRATHSSR